MIMLIT